jgi:FMN hydrolase / 5-amino-6-(5-phospho-D-ribitylamino)uracil phosphatase
MQKKFPQIAALTIDLDDTLWPVWPAIQRAEQQLHAWLVDHAPRMAQTHDVQGLRTLRDQVAQERPEWGHDFTAVRLESLRRGLAQHGYDTDLAEPAFEVFYAARHNVNFYADVEPALARLSRRFPLLALSNGNARLDRVGLEGFFVGTVSAKEVGVAKPNARIFQHACNVLKLPASQVLHVGDDLDLDVAGAVASGLQAVWICRGDTAHAHRAPALGTHTVADLLALADLLGC